MDRRSFLAAPIAAAAAPTPASKAKFSFLHLTDLHIQPEQRATEGCRQCFDHAR